MRSNVERSTDGEASRDNHPTESGHSVRDATDDSLTNSAAHDALTSGLRASAIRVNAARVKAEFEHALLSCLLFNVLYMYYIDHRLIVLFIRMSQIVRLLYFPYESRASQRSTSLLLFMSNVPVLLIHGAVFAEGKVGDMLLINFIGPEPHVLAKLFYVDTVTIFLQSVLASVAAGDSSIVTSFPVLVNHQWHEPDNLVHSNEAEIVPSSRTRTEQLSASRDNGGSQEEHRSGSDDVTVNVL